MKLNLTDYINAYKVFNPQFDRTKNSLEKARGSYHALKTFLVTLEKHTNDFPQLKEIKTTLADLNDYAADLLLQQTNGLIKLTEEVDLKAATNRNKLGHLLAKKAITNPLSFQDSVELFIKDLNHLIEQSKQKTLDEKTKLDDTDLLLLTNSVTNLSVQDKFFGGGVNINAKTSRPNTSLFLDKVMGDVTAKHVTIPGKDELLKISLRLREFLDDLGNSDNKFGFQTIAADSTLRSAP